MVREVFVVPASSGQQRLWFLDRFLATGAAYNVCQAFRLSGDLHADHLRAALTLVVGRHESLRTSFRMMSGELKQLIAPALDVAVRQISLRGPDREAQLHEELARDARQPFDLASAPLMRATLIEVSDTETVLAVVTHHIVVDGWSLTVMFDELSAAYRALAAGQEPSLPALAVQYADFALWERETLQQPDHPGLAFWKERLSGDIVPLELPADRRRPASPSHQGHAVSFHVSGDLTRQLRDVGRDEGGGLFLGALTALAAVLHRYTGTDAVLIGGPIANRLRPELEHAVGFFANTVVFRADVSGDPTLRELFRRVRQDALGVYSHQDTPFDHVVRAVQPDRAADRNPLFQVALAYQRQPEEMFALPGVRVQPLAVSTGTAKFDILIDLQEYDGRTDGVIEVSADLFDPATAQRLRDHFVNALTTLAANPDTPLSTFLMLTPSELAQAITEWNPSADVAVTSTVHGRFARRAAERPDDIAVTHRGASCSYGELERRGNQLASLLAGLGVRTGDLVAVCVEPSIDLVVAILGILKSGAAYLPLDTSYPADRIRFTLTDADVRAVVTSSAQTALVTSHPAPRVLMDEDRARLDAQPSGPVAASVAVDDRCYVIYTSGSTGRPKGVEVTHANVARLFDATDAWFSFGPTDVWTLFHSAAFDFSVWELWGALLYGGRLVVVDYDISRSPAECHALLARERVTVLNQTPSALKQLIDADQLLGGPKNLALRYIILGGEALDPQSLAPWFARHGEEQPRIINMYGITETTVHVTYRPMRALDVAAHRGSVIGVPIPDLQVYLLDAHRQIVPIGVPGEIYVGGDGVARNYLNRPELSAERFVADWFRPGPGRRLYRSGDLAKRLPNGDIEYLGRIDYQVKVRGFRIELGEIESVIRDDASVQDVVVMAREDVPGDTRLVAYVIPRSSGQGPDAGSSADEDQVREWQGVFDRTYALPPPTADPSFNIVGWNSSYTRAPLAEADMREWLTATLARIDALRPSRLWEIGCGTGMILFHVARQCDAYLGTDMAEAAIARLRQQGVPPSVTVERRAADAGSGRPARSFDTVVVNSVAQYFPSVEYLLDVLGHAIDAVADGGAVFVGDVRSFPLLEAFHVAVQVHQASPGLAGPELAERVRRAVAQEQELLLSPAFFEALGRQYPRVTAVEMQLRRGQARNELTEFRYDAVLRIGATPRTCPEPTTVLHWDGDQVTLSDLGAMLEAGPTAIAWRDVPNARVAAHVSLAARLADVSAAQTVDDLRRQAHDDAARAIEPHDVWQLADRCGYRSEITWSRSGRVDRMDISLWHPSLEAGRSEPLVASEPDGGRPDPGFWRQVSSTPLSAIFARQIVPELRLRLRERLPEYMTPSAFVPLERFPLTSNGKLDRRALPPPVVASANVAYLEPSDEVERTLAVIWTDVLGVKSVGLHDDFFDLGGHSILAGRVTARVRQALNVELSFTEVFSATTLGALATLVRHRLHAPVPASPIGKAKRRSRQTPDDQAPAGGTAEAGT